ncbi:phytoene desaturase family protein [Halobaculum sp. MBLA0147]|uniref:phytoene desaturase family protein n=1 Tax=Halobaculum sp. MBLA0147 TaxID=3079934 RepID=UPI003524A39D
MSSETGDRFVGDVSRRVPTEALRGARTVVVGGGIGGLAAAASLAADGADVRLYEQGDRLGGSANLLERDGFRFDTGPSWYLMPGTFERFFAQFDREPSDYYELTRLDPHYRVFWKDGDRAEVSDDLAEVRALFDEYETGAGDALDDYLADAAEAYELGLERFVYTDRSRLRDFLDWDVVKSGRALPMLRSMDEYVQTYVEHPKLRQLLEYTLVFLGGSPYNTPALYCMLSHADLNLGVYYPEGGMYAVVEALRELGAELGVEFRTGAPVTEITATAAESGAADGAPFDRAYTVTTADGPVRADAVVSNLNPQVAEQELLAPDLRRHDDDYWNRQTLAPSAYMLYLGVEGAVEPLEHHTLVLPTDWDDHFASIFDDPAWPEDPAYYVSVPSRTDDTVAPDGHEAVVVLVPIAPGLDDGPATRERYRETVLADLAAYTGVDLRDRIVVEEDACVTEFADHLGAPGGSALGLAHTLDQTGPLRPGHRGGAPGLYFTGGYTTPGIGVPMTLLSGSQTADALRADAEGDRLLPASVPLPF